MTSETLLPAVSLSTSSWRWTWSKSMTHPPSGLPRRGQREAQRTRFTGHNIHTHMYIHMHTYTHTHMYIHMHTYTHTHVHTHAHLHTHTCTYTCTVLSDQYRTLVGLLQSAFLASLSTPCVFCCHNPLALSPTAVFTK